MINKMCIVAVLIMLLTVISSTQSQTQVVTPVEIDNVESLQSVSSCLTNNPIRNTTFISEYTLIFTQDEQIYTIDCQNENNSELVGEVNDYINNLVITDRHIVVSSGNRIIFLDLITKEPEITLEVSSMITSISVAQNYSTFAFGQSNGTITVWNYETDEIIATLDTEFGWGITSIAFTSTIEELISANYLGIIRWNIPRATNEVISIEPANVVIYNARSNQIAYKNDSGYIFLENAFSHTTIELLQSNPIWSNAIGFNPSGSLLFSLSNTSILICLIGKFGTKHPLRKFFTNN